MGKMLSVALGFVLLTSLLLVPSGAAAAAQRIYEATRYIEEDFDGHTGVAVKIFELENLTTLKPLHAPEYFAAEKK